jgi:diaminopimelate decarboxylase
VSGADAGSPLARSPFAPKGGDLHCEDVRLEDLAREHGTPLYVYGASAIDERLAAVARAFPGALACYSVKANPNLSILRRLAERGSGFDIVSEGELVRVLRAGADPERVVFAGVGKTAAEMRRALAAGVLLFNVESGEELALLAAIAREMKKRAPVALRVNPDVDPKTHVYISTGKRENKFGVDLVSAERIARDARASFRDSIDFAGVHVHIGSQIADAAPYSAAAGKAADFALACRAMGHEIRFLNVGGGFGIDYKTASPLPFDAFAAAIAPAAERLDPCRLLLEPGRSVVANAGALVATVIRVKTSGERRFVIVDAAMNDLIRPSLYQAYHAIVPLRVRAGPVSPCDVVGPVCESGDFLALDRPLPPLESGDRLAVLSAGAYGMSMASQYNTRRRAAEILVEGKSARVIRRRETFEQLLENESPAS